MTRDLESALRNAESGPSVPRWQHIAGCADALATGELATLDAALAHWPDAARVAPERWISRALAPPLTIARRIELREVALDRALAEAITRNADTRRVSSIALFAAGTQLDGIAALAHDTTLALRELQLGCFASLDDAAAILADAPLGIEVLTFEGGGATDAALVHLASGAGLPALRHLQAHDTRIGDEGASAVASSARLAPLTFLRLSYCDVGDIGATAIARSPHLRSLAHLGLQMNHVGARGAIAIAGSASLASLGSLFLDANRLGRRGVIAVAESRTLASLHALTLGHARVESRAEERDVGPSGAVALASAAFAKQLTHLDVAGDAIGDEGACALLTEMTALTELDLTMNGLGDRTIAHLLACGALDHLRTLRFEHNEASEDALGKLIDACEARAIEIVL